jgi:conjugal transfer pilus assembly protein TraV
MIPFNPFLSVVCLSLGLVGCTTSHEVFDCPAGKGMGCRSISQVNRMVNQGEIAQDPEPERVSPSVSLSSADADRLSTSLMGEGRVVKRVSEEHLRVWIAPFVDERGDFHEASRIHTVLRPGHWDVTQGSFQG